MTLNTIRGMKDILPPDSYLWVWLENKIRDHFFSRGFMEVRTPILERSELFIRTIGESTDIVEKEMYTFSDRSGDSVTMRPEGTAPVVRSFLHNRGRLGDLPLRIFYMGPMFRHERPQKGRLRQFHQAGAEVVGSEEPFVDADLLIAIFDLLTDLKISSLSLEINSLGCPSCRPGYDKELQLFISQNLSNLCKDCNRRHEMNPLRVLDCKVPGCREVMETAPLTIDHLCEECRTHMDTVVSLLDSSNVPYRINGMMVRGLDYYQKTAFEFLSGSLGAQNAVAAGGRYDGLAKMLGSKDEIPGVGFALGIERLLMVLAGEDALPPIDSNPHIFFAVQSQRFREKAFSLKRDLERCGFFCEMEYGTRSLKSQMRRANKLGSKYVVILGEEEMAKSLVRVKNMERGDDVEIPAASIKEFIINETSLRERGDDSGTLR